jgi:TRAP-type C4-dicarboxylate transport system permease large subunit
VSLEGISKAVVPYIVVLTLVTVLLTAVPQISLWLPRLLR